MIREQSLNTNVEIVIEPPTRAGAINFRELWEFRELFQQMVWRDVTVRYKQAALGIAWVVLTPLITVAIFSVVFGMWGRLPLDGIPAPAFFLAGLISFNFFASALSGSAGSMLSQGSLLTKIYFPRLIAPLSATCTPLVDLLISYAVLQGVALYFGFVPSGRLLWVVPMCVLWAWAAALGLGLWLAALNVYYRDVGQVIPFLTRVLLFASPVVYPVSMIPEKWHWLYGLNPLVGIIEWMRWAFFHTTVPPSPIFGISALLAGFLLVTGVFYFRRMEHTFADVV